MRGFDVLDPDLKPFENHFLEASAGTGKTFAIEHLVIRFLEQGIPLNEILVVTFTRAATVELKERIRKHLTPEQLIQFDEAKIWTIHGFCFQVLQEHAFQTGFSLDQLEESVQVGEIKEIIKDYLRTARDLTPKQLEKILKGDPESLIRQLTSIVSQRLPIEQPDWDYQKEIEALEKVDLDKLYEDLLNLAPQYGKLCDRQKCVKPEVAEGLKRFTEWLGGAQIDPVDLPILKYTEDNKLKRAHSPSLHYPGFLSSLQAGLIPKLNLFSNPQAIFATLAEKARLHFERVVKEEELIFFEDLLRLMAKNVDNPLFAKTVREQYRAVLIDEFQDTDPIQWKIFSTLFLTEKFKGPLYLVGDPKQSIYRFRNADLYTYLAAKSEMGEETHASLQTNFRSTPSLVEALNILFSKDFITLPKTGKSLPCPQVEAASECPPLSDGKGSLHILHAESEELLFSTIVHEIGRLHEQLNIPFRECAVLVSDRYQAERFMKFCSLPTVSKKSRCLLESPAFETMLELMRAVQNPRDRSAIAQVLCGPLFKYPLSQLSELFDQGVYEKFYKYRHLLETEGILPLFQAVIEEASLDDSQLYQDLVQLVEMTVSLKGDYLTFYQNLRQLDPESEELRARATRDEDAIQVMTIHVSKGLEFSIVFPIGLNTPFSTRKSLMRSENRFVLFDPIAEKEEHSEKMRLLYVACTRAKVRLYLPILNTDSPLTSFLKDCDLSHFSQERCQPYPSPVYERPSSEEKKTVRLEKYYPLLAIHSYSSLVHHLDKAPQGEKKEIPKGILPTGPETGTLVHRIFENLPFEIAFHATNLSPFVSNELCGTFLEPWIEEVESMVRRALHEPLPVEGKPFSLAAVNPKKILKEMEFLYPSEDPPGFLKGFIDLFFEHNGGYYIIDWKTNIIDTSLEEVIRQHRYALQAEIYKDAITKYLSIFPHQFPLKGIFYYFLRINQIYNFSL